MARFFFTKPAKIFLLIFAGRENPFPQTLTILLFLFFAMAGCKSEKGESDFIISLTEIPKTEDPVDMNDEASAYYAGFLSRRLFAINADAGIENDLVKSWRETSPGKYEIILENGILFEDGEELTSKDVLFALQRLKDSGRQSWILDGIEELKQKSKYAIQLNTDASSSPNSLFARLSLPATSVYSAKSFTRFQKFVFASSFRLIEKTREKIVFEHRATKQRVVLLAVESPASAYFLFRRKKLALYIPQGIFREMPAARGYRENKRESMTLLYGAIVQGDNDCLGSSALRQQINAHMQASPLLEKTLLGSVLPSRSPVPRSLHRASPKKISSPEKEKVNCSDSVTVFTPSDPERQLIARGIDYILGELGVNSHIRVLEFQAMKRINLNEEPGIYLFKWIADYPHPENFLLPLLHSSNAGSGGNRAFVRDESLDRLLEQYGKTSNSQTIDKIETRLNELAPWVFLGHQNEEVYVQDSLNVSIPFTPAGWGRELNRVFGE